MRSQENHARTHECSDNYHRRKKAALSKLSERAVIVLEIIYSFDCRALV